MTTRFRGVKYRIKVKPIKGPASAYATDPKGRRPKLVFEPQVVGNLEVLIHEALHACFYDLDEQSVDQAGHDIAKFLRKMGVRRPK